MANSPQLKVKLLYESREKLIFKLIILDVWNIISIFASKHKIWNYVELLIETSKFIASRIKNGTIVLVDKEIIGNLNFVHNEKK